MAVRRFLALVGFFLCASWAGGQDIPQLIQPKQPSIKGNSSSFLQSPGVDAQGDPLPPGARARLGSIRFRPGGNITGAALSPDGKWLVSSNNSDILTLSDPNNGKEISRIRLPGGYGAANLIFSPDSKNLAVMSYTPYLQIVAIPSGKPITKLQIPQPNNNRIGSIAFSGDGKIIVASTDNFGQNKNLVHAWEVFTGKLLHNFEIVQNSQIRAALSHDGTLLATSGNYSPRKTGEKDPDQGRTLQLWDTQTGKEIRKIIIDRNQIMAIALSPDGKSLAVASGTATYHLLDTDSGKEVRRFAGRRGHTQVLQFAPDGQTLVAGSADGVVLLWETATGKRLNLTEGPRQRIFSVAFPSPGRVWALGMDGQALALWDAVTGRRLSPDDGHMTWVQFLGYAADGKSLVSGGADGKICWWDAASAKELRHYVIRDEDSSRFGGTTPAGRTINYTLSRDGKYLAAVSPYGNNTIGLIEMATGKILCDFDAPRSSPSAGFVFAPDNSRLAAIGVKGVHVWDVNTGQELPTLPFKVLPANNGNISGGSLAFSPDGSTLAATRSHFEPVTGNPVGETYLWNVEQGTEIACIEQSGYQTGSLAFSPNGQILALPMQSQTVLLIKASTGRELGRLEGSQANFIQGLAFSPDGRLLAGAQQENYIFSPFNGEVPVSSPSNRIFLWELASGQVRQEFSGHQGVVSCLAFAPDGRTLASGSYDTTVVLWDTSGKRSEKFAGLPIEKIEAAWHDLAEKNGKRAYHDLMTALISSPEATIEVFRKAMQPAHGIKASPQEIDHLIGELDNDSFAVRVKATTSLEQLGDLAGPALHKAELALNSLESQRRLKILLDRLDRTTYTPDEIRLVRAVEVLEKIDTVQARDLLQTLAGGAPQNRLTMEVRAALGRLKGISR